MSHQLAPRPADRPHSLAALRALISSDQALSTLLEWATVELGDDPGHDAAHALRVALWTIRLGDESVDPREAIAAALLHDGVNLPKNHPERHLASQLSAELALRLASERGFSQDAAQRISDAVRDHSFSRGATPEHPLGRALQDADRLEALGAIGLFRTISTGTRMGARYFHDDDPWATSRSLDDLRYSIDHFFTKLLKLAPTLLTDAGRAEAARRSAFLEATLVQLGDELGVPCPPSTLPS